ncbi:M15 family metallopeptidase [Breznakiella homolactica]|uniref:M15 family metallopeptidase n=1 Tax=Breznakiella homolactica TaxID=2798577 RepID=A0A7T7XPZ7_9SPIR|nr:M15 family metallopeptidase [Breznakiella homolactica]QQO10329.1 M15 family metallopeptidase [Breznakiella homolactica]
MGIIKSVDRLQPELARRTRIFLEYCREHAIDVCIIETLRRLEVQEAYYAQGRKPLETVNELRKKAGLWAITESENSRTVTNTMKSRHMEGNAVDICPMKNGKPWWNAPDEVWEEIGILAETFGLDWCAGGYGQTWGKGWDNPHFELMANFPGN